MRRLSLLLAPPVVLVGAALWALAGQSEQRGIDQAQDRARGDYWYSSDPELELVRVTFTGGQVGIRLDYILFADDRLVVEKSSLSPTEARRLERVERRVDHAAVDSLLRHLIDGGVADLGPERIKTLKELRLKYASSDAGTVQFRLRLPNYRKAGAASEKEIDVPLSFPGGINSWVSSYPDVKEFLCLRDFVPMVVSLGENGG